MPYMSSSPPTPPPPEPQDLTPTIRNPAKPADWETTPFSKPITVPWSLTLTPTHISAFRLGFIPDCMEDRWFIYSTEPDPEIEGEEKVMTLKLFRSWSGLKYFEVVVVLDGDQDGEVDGGGRVKELVFESDEENVGGLGEREGKEMCLGVIKAVLRVDICGVRDERADGAEEERIVDR